MNVSVPGSEPPRKPVLFADPAASPQSAGEQERNWVPWVIACAAIAILLALAFWLGGARAPQTPSAANQTDPYASSVTLSEIQMSQASNFAGGQITYIDGKVTNHGDKTVTGIQVRAVFPNDAGEPNQTEEVPLSLIRSRDPYVDTVPVNVSPLAPGASQEFRLIFEDISPMWNQQTPRLKVLRVQTRG